MADSWDVDDEMLLRAYIKLAIPAEKPSAKKRSRVVLAPSPHHSR